MMINRLFDRGTYHALREYNVYIYIYIRARVYYRVLLCIIYLNVMNVVSRDRISYIRS